MRTATCMPSRRRRGMPRRTVGRRAAGRSVTAVMPSPRGLAQARTFLPLHVHGRRKKAYGPPTDVRLMLARPKSNGYVNTDGPHFARSDDSAAAGESGRRL